MKFNCRLCLPVCVVALLSACASDPAVDPRVSTLEGQLSSARSESDRLRSEVDQLKNELESKSETKMMETPVATTSSGDYAALPPDPKPGHCYARVLIPPQYTTETRQVLVNPESEIIDVTDPVYEWAEETVLVKEASKQLKVIPAEYGWVEEQVLVKEAGKELVTIPAQFDTTTEQVLVREAHTTWKKGRGPIERVDNLTGEIMCLVEVPAEYKTVTKRVMVSPARTEEREIPAVYDTVKKRVMTSPPRTIEEEIPAEYKTVRVRKLMKPAGEIRRTIPAEYKTVAETRKTTEGHLDWREILCETNTHPGVIRKLQSALRGAGYDPGAIDGVIGHETRRAISQYQRDKGLPADQITIETLNSLGVM